MHLSLVEDGDAVLRALREHQAEVPGRRHERVLVGRLRLRGDLRVMSVSM